MKTRQESRSLGRKLVLSMSLSALCALSVQGAAVFWDTSPVIGIQGGEGQWNTTEENWTTDSGVTNFAWDNVGNAGDIAVFGSPGGAVTLTEAINLGGITVISDGYSVVGESLNFGSASGSLDTSALGTTGAALATISSNLTGTGGLTIASHGNVSPTGAGSAACLVIDGDNTGLSGGIAITSGLVFFPDQDAVGGNALTLSGGGGLLHSGADTLTLNNDVTVEASGTTMRVWGGVRNLELTGALSGSGDIQKTDSGRLTLAGDLVGYSGTLNLLDGNATIASDFGGDAVVSTGTLTFEGVEATGTVTLNAGAVDVEWDFDGTALVNGGVFDINGLLGGSATIDGGTLVLGGGFDGTSLDLLGGRLEILGGNYAGNLQFGAGSVLIGFFATMADDVIAQTGADRLELLGFVLGDVIVGDGVETVFEAGPVIDGDLVIGTDTSSTNEISILEDAMEVRGELTVNGNLVIVIDGSTESGEEFLLVDVINTDTGVPGDHITVVLDGPANLVNVQTVFTGSGIAVTYDFGTTWVGGPGTWDTVEANWSDDDFFTTFAWDNTANASDIAYFVNGNGRIEVTEDINLAGIVSSSTEATTIGGRAAMTYVLQGDGNLDFGTQEGMVDTQAAGLLNFQINNNLMGEGGLRVVGADAPTGGQGWLYLIGDNSGLTGGITVENGLIGVASPEGLGSNSIFLQGNAGLFGPISYAGPETSALNPADNTLVLGNDIEISGDDNVLRVWGGRTMVLEGTVSGDGNVLKGDTGTLVFTAENSGFSGDILVENSGILRATADDGFGTGLIDLDVTGGTTRIELSGATVGNEMILNSASGTSFEGTLTAIDDEVSTVNGDITILRSPASGGQLGARGSSTLVLNGELNVGGTQAFVTHRLGTIVYAGGGSTNFTLGVNGTARLGAENGLPTGVILNLDLSPTPATVFDLNGFNQTLSGFIHTPTNAARSFVVTGGGTLTVNAGQNTELGPGGTLTAARNVTANMSGLEEFVWNGEDYTFRVGLRSGAGNSHSGSTGVHTALMADTNTISATLLAVGDLQANNHGGNAFLRLGENNTLNADTINVGASNRSNATLNFRDGLDTPTVTIRGTDGVAAVGSWDVGRVANFASNTWSATVDFSTGELDALVDVLRVAIANPMGNPNRQGIQNSTFSVGSGVLDVGTLIVGELSGTSGGSAGTYAANGTFNVLDAGGLVRVGEVILANNVGTATGGARTVSGIFNLAAGVLETSSISRGEQTGTADLVNAELVIGDGILRNPADEDLVVAGLSVTLDGDSGFEATGSQTITVDLGSAISGPGSLVKTGSGTLLIEPATFYSGDTVVQEGTLVLEVASLDDNSAVFVNSGAVIDLPHGELDTIAQLWVDGVQQPAGTYDSSNPFITGTGALVVTEDPPAVGAEYAAWLTDAGLTPGAAGTGFFENIDGSGVANIVQFALGGNPNDPTDNGTQVLFTTDADDNDGLVLTIAVRAGAVFAGAPSPEAELDGITYSIQGSADLEDWTSAVEEVTVKANGIPSPPAGYELRSFRLIEAPALDSLGFLRVSVDGDEE